MDELVNSLAFEIETIPQDNAIKINSSSNMTPVNMKIRLRKKPNARSQNTAICISKYDHLSNVPERVIVASSDQTIMSFDMFTEAHLEKHIRNPKKYFFRRCLGAQYDDDDDNNPYMTNATKDTAASRSDSILKKKMKLPKNNVYTGAPQIVDKKQKKFFGKCKPGGCLDPPYGEDKYSYQPKKESSTYGAQKEYGTACEKQPCAPYKGINNTVTTILKNNTIATKEKQIDSLANNVLNLYQNKDTKTLLDDNDSDSIITYPSTLSYSGLNIYDEWIEKCAKSNKSSNASKAKKSFNEFSASYFTPKDASISKVIDKKGIKIEKYDIAAKIQTETTDTMDRQKEEGFCTNERVRHMKETDPVTDSAIEVKYEMKNENKYVTQPNILTDTLKNSNNNIEEKSNTLSVNNHDNTENIATFLYNTKSNLLKDTETFKMRAENYCSDINKNKIIKSFTDENNIIELLENKKIFMSDKYSEEENELILHRIDDKNISIGAGTNLNINYQSSIAKETSLQQDSSSTIDKMRQSQVEGLSIKEVIYKRSKESNDEIKTTGEDGNDVGSSDMDNIINSSLVNVNIRKRLSSTDKNQVETTEPQSLITESKLNKSDTSTVASDISKIENIQTTTQDDSFNFSKKGYYEVNKRNISNLRQFKLEPSELLSTRKSNDKNDETLSLTISPELNDKMSNTKPPTPLLDSIVTDIYISDQFNNSSLKINKSSSHIISQVSLIHVPSPAKTVSLNKELDIPLSEQINTVNNKIFASKIDTPKETTDSQIPIVDQLKAKIEEDIENKNGNNLFLSESFPKLDIKEQQLRRSLYDGQDYTEKRANTLTAYKNHDNNPFDTAIESFTYQYGENISINALNFSQGKQISTDTKIELLDTLNSNVNEYHDSASYNEQQNILFEKLDVRLDEYMNKINLVQNDKLENYKQSKDQYTSEKYHNKDENTLVNNTESFYKPNMVQNKEDILKVLDFPQQEQMKTITETESSNALIDDNAPKHKTELKTINIPKISERANNNILLHATKSQSKEKIEQQHRTNIFNEGVKLSDVRRIDTNIDLLSNDVPKVESSFQRMQNIIDQENIDNLTLSNITETQLIPESHAKQVALENTPIEFKNEVMISETIFQASNKVKHLEKLPPNICNSLQSNREANMLSSKNCSSTPSIILDMAFRSYRKNSKARVITSLEVVYAEQHPNPNVIILKSLVNRNGEEIIVPIDAETDMTIKIKTGSSNGRCYSKNIQSELSNDQYNTELDYFDSIQILKAEEDYRRDNTAKYPHKLESRGHDVLLASIYEHELVPLQNLIKSLKEDIDALARKSILIKDRLHSSRKKPIGLIRNNRRCGCTRK